MYSGSLNKLSESQQRINDRPESTAAIMTSLSTSFRRHAIVIPFLLVMALVMLMSDIRLLSFSVLPQRLTFVDDTFITSLKYAAAADDDDDDDATSSERLVARDSASTQSPLPLPRYNISNSDFVHTPEFLEFWHASRHWSTAIDDNPTVTSLSLRQKLKIGSKDDPPRKLRKPSRMLVGIFTGASMTDRRQVLRETSLNFHNDMQGFDPNESGHRERLFINTWSSYYRVCSLYELQTQQTSMKDCLLTYVFVVAGGSNIDAPPMLLQPNVSHPMVVPNPPPEYQNETDVVFLNIQENMNEGKTPTWFRYASTTLPQEYGLEFNYIAKMDDDTLLFTGNWIDILERRLRPPHRMNQDGLVYGGKANNVLHAWHWRCHDAKTFADCPVIGPTWMIGPFYFLSRKLAAYITSNVLDQETLQSYEDVATATYVFSHPKNVTIVELNPSSALLDYHFGWDWTFRDGSRKYRDVVFAHSENACYMPTGPYYKRPSNVRKVWKEYIQYRWRQRSAFRNMYRLDDHPTLDHGENPRNVSVHQLDYIYSNDDFDASPIVVGNPYHLVFFPIAGIGDVVWRCWIRRLLGYADWDNTTRQFDDLTYLSDYTVEEASEIMSSPKYTRAMFLRQPLERVKSIYLQLIQQDDPNTDMLQGCDCARGCETGTLMRQCRQATRSFRTFLTDLVSTCDKSYWRPQSSRMEPKYFRLLDFVGYYEDFIDDALTLLQRIVPSGSSMADWIHRKSLQESFARLEITDRKEDFNDRFSAFWSGAFVKRYESDRRSDLLSKYDFDIIVPDKKKRMDKTYS